MIEDASGACKASNCSEREYQELQKAIIEYKRKLPSKQYTQQDYLPANHKVEFNNAQKMKWLYTTFKLDNASNDEDEPIYDNSKWNITDNISNGHECRGIIFKSKSTINYGISFVKIKVKLNFKGNSEFWLFLRGKGELSPPTSVIKISQNVNEEEDKQSLPIVTVSLGTYLLSKNSNNNNNNQLKFFRKEQLIPDKPDKIRDNKETTRKQLTSLQIEVIDNGKETIKLSVEANGCGYVNETRGNFFIPTNDECNILFAGSGHKCELNNLSYETDVHSNYERAKDTENNCIVF